MLSRGGARLHELVQRMSMRKQFGCFDSSHLAAGICRGTDEYGNTYWESSPNRARCATGNPARWIVPANFKRFDASQIPVGWYGWLQSVTDDIPTEDPLLGKQPWVEPREPLALSRMGTIGDLMPPGYLSHQLICNAEHEHSFIQHMQQEMGDPIPKPEYSAAVRELISENMDGTPDVDDPIEQQRETYMHDPREAAHHGRNIVGRMVGQDHYQPWVPARYDAEPPRVI